MLAFALCLALFSFWWVVGYAIVKALHATRSPLQDVLLAAPVGVVATVIPVWTVNRFDVPVGRFGGIVAAALLVGAAAVLWRLWRRGPAGERYPGVPWRQLGPFFVLLVIALAATARPMFAFGFDWVSYCNDDMANYCMAADRFYRQGFFEFPQPDTLLKGTYWPNAYWFMHVMTRQRPGCELLIAWAMSVTGLNAHEVFMPVIVALHVGLVASATGLVLSPLGAGPRRRTGRDGGYADDLPGDPAGAGGGGALDGNYLVAWVAGVLIALSALSTLGLMYQLIAQVSGLSLLATVGAMILRQFDGLPRSGLVRHGVLVGIMGAGILIIYPEVVPFLGLSFLIYAALAVLRGRMRPAPVAVVLLLAVVVTVLLLRVYSLQSVTFMLSQSRAAKVDSAGGGVARTMFPYFMVPKGLADLWGLLQLGWWKTGSLVLNLGILGGGLLTVFVAAAAARFTARGRPEATVTLVMFGLGVVLFTNRSGFGLFKLAMYLQPFMLATLAVAWFATVGWLARRASGGRAPGRLVLVLGAVPLLLLAALGLGAQSRYVLSSYGVGTSFLEIPDPSRTRINDEFRAAVDGHGPGPVISDTFNIVLAKFQAMYTRGRELVFPSNRFTRNIEDLEELEQAQGRLTPQQFRRVLKYQNTREAGIPTRAFDMKDPAQPGSINIFRVNDRRFGVAAPGHARPAGAPGEPDPLLVISTGRQSVFNRWHFPPLGRANFTAVPLGEAQNILVFIASELGQPYFFSGLQGQPAIYQIEEEPDDSPFFRGGTMCGVGRYLLAQVFNPTPKGRLALSITLSYHADGINQLPPDLAVIGAQRVPLPVVGRGSARLFSPPVEPQWIDGRAYLMYDLGTAGRQFPWRRTGLMKLFGSDVPIDRRILSGFGRDVSLVSEEQYASLRPPSVLSNFRPDDTNHLRDRHLEYSGLYEDGWMGEDAYVRVTQPRGSARVAVRGQVPRIGNNDRHAVRAVLSVDGQVVAEATVTPGEFELAGTPPPLRGSSEQSARSSAGQAGDPKLPSPPAVSPPADAPGVVRTVRLQFIGPVQNLNPPDNRPAAALLRSIGFDGPPVAER